MSKISELSLAIEELHRCGNALIDVAETLVHLLGADSDFRGSGKTETNGTATPAVNESKLITLEEVRAVLADKSRAGFTADIRNLLKKYGADKLSEIDTNHYTALLADAEVLGNG